MMGSSGGLSDPRISVIDSPNVADPRGEGDGSGTPPKLVMFDTCPRLGRDKEALP